MLENYFNYKKHKTDFKTEVIAGTTTFLTMAYIMFLNPFILSGEFAGPEKGFFDFGAVYTATILATALACFIMAFYGKTWPIGLAPVNNLIKAYETNAKAIPLLILYVKGIAIIARIAGADSAISSHSISVIFLTKRTETKSKAAPSICFGRLVAKGAKKIQARNSKPITNEVIPVFPPALTPAPDST